MNSQEPDVALGPLNDSFKWFLASLPYSATPTAVKQFFSSFGTVNFVKIVWDNKLNKSKGYGFMYMYDLASDAEIEQFAKSHANRIRLLGKNHVLLQRHDQKRVQPIRDPSKRSHNDHVPVAGYGGARPAPSGSYGPASTAPSYSDPSSGPYGTASTAPSYSEPSPYDSYSTGPPPSVGPYGPASHQQYGGYDQGTQSYDGYASAAPSPYAAGGGYSADGPYAGGEGYYESGPGMQQPSYTSMSASHQSSGGGYGYDASYGPPANGGYGGYEGQSYSASYSQPSMAPHSQHRPPQQQYDYNEGYGPQTHQPGSMRHPPPPPPARRPANALATKIFLKNLPVDVTPRDVVQFLAKQHSVNVRRCTMEYDPDPSFQSCFAHVDVASPGEALRLVDKSSQQLLVFHNGEVLHASLDSRPPPDGVNIPVGMGAPVSTGPRPPPRGGRGGGGRGDFRGRGGGRPPSREGRRSEHRPY